MNDDLRELLTDAVDGVEPADRLHQIRARTATPARRPWRYAVGGVVLATAATVAAVVVLTGDAGGPDPAPEPAVVPSTPPAGPAVPTMAAPVYFVGDTPAGPRLFREFRQVPQNDPAAAAATLMATGDALDPDYRTLWPAGWGEWSIGFDGIGDAGSYSVRLPDASWTTRPATMTEDEAALAVEQLVRTLQGRGPDRAPVVFHLRGASVPILGIEPGDRGVTATPGIDLLSPVSISDPTEGRVADGSFTARGVADAPEGTVVLSLEQDGTTVWEQPVVAEGAYGDRLWAWTLGDIDVSALEPGSYTFVATVDGPAPEDRQPPPWTDTRTVVIE